MKWTNSSSSQSKEEGEDLPCMSNWVINFCYGGGGVEGGGKNRNNVYKSG